MDTVSDFASAIFIEDSDGSTQNHNTRVRTQHILPLFGEMF